MWNFQQVMHFEQHATKLNNVIRLFYSRHLIFVNVSCLLENRRRTEPSEWRTLQLPLTSDLTSPKSQRSNLSKVSQTCLQKMLIGKFRCWNCWVFQPALPLFLEVFYSRQNLHFYLVPTFAFSFPASGRLRRLSVIVYFLSICSYASSTCTQAPRNIAWVVGRITACLLVDAHAFVMIIMVLCLYLEEIVVWPGLIDLLLKERVIATVFSIFIRHSSQHLIMSSSSRRRRRRGRRRLGRCRRRCAKIWHGLSVSDCLPKKIHQRKQRPATNDGSGSSRCSTASPIVRSFFLLYIIVWEFFFQFFFKPSTSSSGHEFFILCKTASHACSFFWRSR